MNPIEGTFNFGASTIQPMVNFLFGSIGLLFHPGSRRKMTHPAWSIPFHFLHLSIPFDPFHSIPSFHFIPFHSIPLPGLQIWFAGRLEGLATRNL